MLTQMRDNFRAQGFEAEMNAVAVRVQVASSEEEKSGKVKIISDFESKAQNCYLSAEELSGELAKLPKPKKEKA